MTPEDITREHVKCNVTGLVQLLFEDHNEWAVDMMCGDVESSTLAYDAFEVWIVSHWLSKQLAKEGHRVAELDYQHYWARGAAGQSISMDPVIAKIAKGAA